MEDEQILELYWERSEEAIGESEKKYGRYCRTIAQNILHSPQDAEECVNDTWLRAWNAIPPSRPKRLAVFLGRITRNLAIDRWRRSQSEKYGGGQIILCLDELAEYVGTQQNLPDDLALKEALQSFLAALKRQTARIFMLRYWHMYPIKEIARLCGISEGAVKMSLQRTGKQLKAHLQKEDIEI